MREGKKMILDKELLKENADVINRKKCIWESRTKLKFDVNGRALIGKIGKPLTFNDFIEYFSGNNSMKNISKSFMKSFNEYLEDNNLQVYLYKYKIEKIQIYKNFDKEMLAKSLLNYNNYESILFKKVRKIDNPEDIGLEILLFNKLRVCSKYGSHNIKFTRVLAEVQKYWEKDNPEYIEVVNKIRYREYLSVDEKDKLIQRKLKLEENNLYFDQQKIMNKSYLNGGELWLSINPIDELTASGCKYEDKECYPTSFNTCIRNKISTVNNELCIESQSNKSNPDEQLLLSKIINKGIIYIKNRNTIKGENIELLGYKLRANIWLDTNSIFISKFYPLIGEVQKEDIYNRLREKAKVKISDIIDDHKLEIQDFNNNKILQKAFYDNHKNIHIDDIYIKDNEVYLTDNFFKNISFVSLKNL